MTPLTFECRNTRMQAHVIPGKRRGTWTCIFTFKKIERFDKIRQVVFSDETEAMLAAEEYVKGLPYPELSKRWKPRPINNEVPCLQ